MAEHPSFGTTLAWDRAGGTSYTNIAQVVSDISGPGFSRGSIDVTNHADTDMFRQKMPGLIDAGQISFQVAFDPAAATHNWATGLLDDFDNSDCTLAAFKITMNVCTASVTSSTWTFDGFVAGAAMSAGLEDVHRMDVTVEITGKPTLTIVTP
jgi:hypothetical protein